MLSKRFLISVCLLAISFGLGQCNSGSHKQRRESIEETRGGYEVKGVEHFGLKDNVQETLIGKETISGGKTIVGKETITGKETIVGKETEVDEFKVKEHIDLVETKKIHHPVTIEKDVKVIKEKKHPVTIKNKKNIGVIKKNHHVKGNLDKNIKLEEHNVAKKIAIADDGDKERTTLAGFLDQILFDPLASLLEYLKNVLQKITIDLDEFLIRVAQALANFLNGILEVLIVIVLSLIDILGDLVPGLLGNLVDELEGKIDECQARYPLDPVNDTLVELAECITDPVYHIIEDLSVVLTDVQKLLIIIDGGLEEIEESMKLQSVARGVYDILRGTVTEVLEILADLVAGPVADILIAVPELLACILGDIGRNLLGEIIAFLTGYVKCISELI